MAESRAFSFSLQIPATAQLNLSAPFSLMATILRAPCIVRPPSILAPKSRSPPCLSIKQRLAWRPQLRLSRLPAGPLRHAAFRPLAAAQGETTETEEEISIQEESDDEINVNNVADINDAIDGTEEKVASVVLAALQSYKEALTNDDRSTVAEIESFLLSIEEEKNALAKNLAALSEEMAIEKDRVLRISADFDNFRKRTERDRKSLMTNVQGEVVESLLPVLDNFERAKTQIKVETEGEEKINNSYQSIYKQFSEILSSLGVEAVETVGHLFDPLLHEAIMQEESAEFEEGMIILEFRKGFKLGERLLRPAMVKVSSGPGPSKSEPEDEVAPSEVGDGETYKEIIESDEVESGEDDA